MGMRAWDVDALDDPAHLERHDPALRRAAEWGARVRMCAEAARPLAERLAAGLHDRPRAVIAVGNENRLLRATLEMTCPVPFVAWPFEQLPPWVGPLDIVVGQFTGAAPAAHEAAVGPAAVIAEATRRGADVLMVVSAEAFDGPPPRVRYGDLVVSPTDDHVAIAVSLLALLGGRGLAPTVDPDAVAAALDETAVRCGPARPLADNPAKAAAAAMAGAPCVFWGGSVLAARAARRGAEALREATGVAATAGTFAQVWPIVRDTAPRDIFADPDDGAAARPVLVILDDGAGDAEAQRARARLEQAAVERDIRIVELAHTTGHEVTRFAALWAQAQFAATYVAVGRSA